MRPRSLALSTLLMILTYPTYAGEWWLMRNPNSATCIVQNFHDKPPFGIRWKGPFISAKDAHTAMCQQLSINDRQRCAAVIPVEACSERSAMVATQQNAQRVVRQRREPEVLLNVENVFPPPPEPEPEPEPQLRGWLWRIGCHSPWDATCSGSPQFAAPEGFQLCKYGATELSNTQDGNSNWWIVSVRPNSISVHVESAGSLAFFDQWGSWVEVELDITAIESIATTDQRRTAGCNIELASSAACVCTRSSQSATEDCYTQAGGTCIARLDLVFADCVDTMFRCSSRGGECGLLGGTLMYFPQNRICN